MASHIVNQENQFTALGSFTLEYIVDGEYRRAETPYISERQRQILESRAALSGEPEPELEMERRLS